MLSLRYQTVAGGANYYIWARFEVDTFYYERRCYMGGFRSLPGNVYKVLWIACSYKPIDARSDKKSKYDLYPKKPSKKTHHKHHKHDKHSSSSSSSSSSK